ncbi:C4-dicarboxylate anaerobic carrier [Perkinsela sp. CCAP 1560/4]|nr:C4-dicarboxylate anaerobic carrier [Perkinsela sp. CCAP 1560/4]|eukprot:KNH07363.1 C4-dicarboxylate anaerobic carrier [Perkinsela sp. CCAP 1560/4]
MPKKADPAVKKATPTKPAAASRKKTPVAPKEKKAASSRKKTPVKEATPSKVTPKKATPRPKTAKKTPAKVVKADEPKTPRMTLRSGDIETVAECTVAELLFRFLYLMAFQVLLISILYYIMRTHGEMIKGTLIKYFMLFQ